MTTRFMAFSFFAWFIGGMLGAVYEGTTLDGGAYDALLQFQVFRQFEVNLPLVASLSFPLPNPDYFTDLMSALTWNSSLWADWASYLRVLILMSLSFAFGLPLLMSFFGARLSR
jgi:hypothetical protein